MITIKVTSVTYIPSWFLKYLLKQTVDILNDQIL